MAPMLHSQRSLMPRIRVLPLDVEIAAVLCIDDFRRDSFNQALDMLRDLQKRHGIDKPIWLTETNAMPSDDQAISCPHTDTPIQTTMDQQASYAVQAFAMAAAAGYQRSEFYQMVDQNPCTEPAVWGVTRDDGSRRSDRADPH